MNQPQGGKRPGAGRKSIRIDLEQVEKLCGLQCTDLEFGVNVRTIERRKRPPVFAEDKQAILDGDGRTVDDVAVERKGVAK